MDNEDDHEDDEEDLCGEMRPTVVLQLSAAGWNSKIRMITPRDQYSQATFATYRNIHVTNPMPTI
jgi:hypothetical protein